MPVEHFADSDGEGFTKNGSSLEWSALTGDITVSLANQRGFIIQGVGGELISRFDIGGMQHKFTTGAFNGDVGDEFFSWPNPEDGFILIDRLILDITTPSSGACTADFGTSTVSESTSSDNLIDGLSVAVAGVFDNMANGGTNGKFLQKLAVGKWLNGKRASGASAGLEGRFYLSYFLEWIDV